MGLKNWLDALCHAPSIAELSRQLAQRSYALVRDSVGPQVFAFSRAEARGYVRAKAAPVIRSEARALAGRYPGLSVASLGIAVSQASDRVVQSVLTDLNRERTRQMLGRAA
ncbi:MAG TPA: hypothetical protein VNH11_28400 [Pirellulales bacterium]|nr:hypothetical protein [Pirellulales bacterium]